MARGALRGAGRAAGQQHDVRGLGGVRRDLAGVAGDQLLEGVAVDLVIGPRQHAPQARLDRPDQALVLGVVDKQRHALALATSLS